MATQEVTFSIADVGCYVESARGIYAGERVQEIAAEYGWKGEHLSALAEWYSEATDEASEFLNDLLGDNPECLAWSWHDCDFGLYAFCAECGEWRDHEKHGTLCEDCREAPCL